MSGQQVRHKAYKLGWHRKYLTWEQDARHAEPEPGNFRCSQSRSGCAPDAKGPWERVPCEQGHVIGAEGT